LGHPPRGGDFGILVEVVPGRRQDHVAVIIHGVVFISPECAVPGEGDGGDDGMNGIFLRRGW
jgi:hypothetical protein